MKPSRKKRHSPAITIGAPTPDETPTILQFRVWLKGLSPMVWRRVQVASIMTLGTDRRYVRRDAGATGG